MLVVTVLEALLVTVLLGEVLVVAVVVGHPGVGGQVVVAGRQEEQGGQLEERAHHGILGEGPAT